nr:transposase [uncultured bacterium]
MATKTKTKKSKPKPKSKDREIIKFDYAMKYILRDKSNFGILEGFLSELIGRKVKVLDILESEGNIDRPGDKVNRVDLKAKIDNGEMAIFEIQFSDMADFLGKVLYNASRAIVEQVKKGGDYYIKKLYMVNIANFDLGAKRDYVFLAKMAGFKGVHFNEIIPFAQRDELAPPKSKKKDIHPEYYLILPEMFDEEIRDRFDEWVYTLKTSVVKAEFKAAGLKEAGEKLDLLKMSPEERRAYERHLDNTADFNSMMRTNAEKNREEGREEGKAEGLAQGKAEATIENAKKMKNKGYPAKDIAEITGLSIEEVESL